MPSVIDSTFFNGIDVQSIQLNWMKMKFQSPEAVRATAPIMICHAQNDSMLAQNYTFIELEHSKSES